MPSSGSAQSAMRAQYAPLVASLGVTLPHFNRAGGEAHAAESVAFVEETLRDAGCDGELLEALWYDECAAQILRNTNTRVLHPLEWTAPNEAGATARH